jgi:alternate F1F0 ATPase F1 subunit epsilon
MRLKLLIPTRVVADEEVVKVVTEGEHGSFCLLPEHVDFLAALVPGLLAFEDEAGQERFVAVDEGVLVKRGDEVLVLARQASRQYRRARLVSLAAGLTSAGFFTIPAGHPKGSAAGINTTSEPGTTASPEGWA